MSDLSGLLNTTNAPNTVAVQPSFTQQFGGGVNDLSSVGGLPTGINGMPIPGALVNNAVNMGAGSFVPGKGLPQMPSLVNDPTMLQQSPSPGVDSLPAISASYATNQKALTAKYQPNSPVAKMLAAYPQESINALQQLDQQRVVKGQAPLNAADTASVLLATKNQSQQPGDNTPWWNLWSNAQHDLGNIVTNAIPSLLSLPGAISHDPSLALKLIPGVQTAERVGSGDFTGIAQHPISTFLDLVPYLNKLAAGTDVVNAASDAASARQAGLGVPMREPSPIRTALTRTLDDSGNVVPNRLGSMIQGVGNSTIGQPIRDLMQQAFGGDARAAMIRSVDLAHQASNYVAGNASPETLANFGITDLGELPKLRDELAAAHPTITSDPALAADTVRRMESGDINQYTSATPEQQSYMDQFRNIQDSTIKPWLADNAGMKLIGGELYDQSTGGRIIRAQTRAQKAVSDLLQVDENGDSARLSRIENWGQMADGTVAPEFQALHDLIAQGDFKAARQQMQNLQMRWTNPVSPKSVGEAEGPAATTRLASLSKLQSELKNVTRSMDRLDAAESSSIPARFAPYRDAQVDQKILDTYGDTPENRNLVANRMYDQIDGFSQAAYNKLVSKTTSQWQDWRDQGIDPTFVHHVSESRALNEINKLDITNDPRMMMQEKARGAGRIAYTQDPQLILSHQLADIARSQGQDMYRDWIQQHFTKPGTSLDEQYAPAAQQLLTRRPNMDMRQALDQMIARDYSPYSASNYGFKPSTGFEDGKAWIPKNLGKTLEQASTLESGPFAKAMAPISGAFRTAVLPLDPRFYFHHLVGSLVMGAGQGGADFLSNLPKAWSMIKAAREGTAEIPPELQGMLGTAQKDILGYQFGAGSKLRQLYDAVRGNPSLPPDASAAPGFIERAKSGLNNIENRGYDVIQHFDNAYRIASYLGGESKAIRAGLSPEEATNAGLNVAAKSLQDWRSLTPIERAIVKQVFPFYGMTQHILRYALSYPADHPYVASILGNLVSSESQDAQSGLPSSFNDLFNLGSPDKNGMVNALSTKAFNPFRDVANMMSLSGWLGGTNPVIKTLLEQAGVSPTGNPQVYPNLRYDSTTGRLVVDTSNPFLNLLNNTIPQTQLLSELTGNNASFKAIAAANPEAAKQQIASQLGLPVVLKSYNLPEEQMKEQLRINSAARDALKQAMATGDYSYAAQFPTLAARLNQLAALRQTGALQPFTLPGQDVQAAQDQLLQSLGTVIPIGL